MESLIYQDNKSTIIPTKNGCGYSSKRTRHINVSYLFIKDRFKYKEASIDYCPTNKMISNFFSKQLQGSKFIKSILNIQD